MIGDVRVGRIGDADIIQIVDTELRFSAAKVFPGLDDDDYKSFSTDEVERAFTLPVLVYVIVIEGYTIVIDTGVGDPPEAGDAIGALRRGLSKANIEARNVDSVVYTHLHPDHIGGGVDAAGHLAFPNARYLASSVEWAFWSQPVWREPSWKWLGDAFERRLDPVERAGNLELVAADDALGPRVQARSIAGHTPGQIGIEIDTGASTILFIGDALHHPAQWRHPNWNWRDDTDADQASKRRADLGREMQNSDTVIASAHFPLPGIGRVASSDAGIVWEPIDL